MPGGRSPYGDAFKGTAVYYARYRPPYPAQFFEFLGRAFDLDGTGRLLDLGCGTGQVAVPLASSFREVVAMDPEPEMLAEAERAMDEAGVRNVTLAKGGSSDLPALLDNLGMFRLVTMGSSFHWMDRAATLEVLSRMVEPGGGIALASSGSMWTDATLWCRAVKATVQRWLGEERRAGSSAYSVPAERHEDIIDRSRFGPHERHVIRYRREWTVDSITGYLYSTSFCSPRLLGDKRDDFERDLRETLLRLGPKGPFTEEVALEVLLGRLKNATDRSR